jgi:amino acid adenylation domain-containing protein/thioester reductase-like protein
MDNTARPQQPATGRASDITDQDGCRLRDLFHETRAEFPQCKLTHELFEEQAAQTPTAEAVIYQDKSLTYAELNSRANQIARYLREQEVTPDRLVGVCMERSEHMVASLLGILKAGGAYLPLDLGYPTNRLAYMLSDAEPTLLLAEEELPGKLAEPLGRVIPLHKIRNEAWDYESTNLHDAASSSSPQNLVYVIYTSGSTGRPKATEMAHRSMVNLIEWHRKAFAERQKQRVLQFAALSFDVAFQEIFTTLCTGNTLVLLDDWVRKDARALLDLLKRERIQRLFLPPLVLQSLAESCSNTGWYPDSLLDVITAGEQLRISPQIVSLFRHLSECRLHNHYGPTETHVVTALTLTGDPDRWPSLPSIGRPIANTQVHVLDEEQRPLPIGAEGEIYLGGVCVARGYFRRPELTSQRFVRDPFSPDPQARLYKTGDVGRWRPDGTLDYLGRNDEQVKIRGFRVELGEIEAQLSGHHEVKEAAVIAREDEPGDKRLVAYITLRHQEGTIVEQLREYLQSVLPDYMVPAAFVTLETVPLTPNGKLDRRALPAPDRTAYASRQYEAPQGELEQVLAHTWQELLRLERVGRQDRFFELGGHSLLIVQMLERLRQAGLSAQGHHLFANLTLAELASALIPAAPGDSRVPPNLIPSGCEAIKPDMLPLISLTSEHLRRIEQAVPGGAANIQDIYSLSPLQEGILFHHLLSRQQGDAYVLPMLLSLASRASLDKFIGAVRQVIARHDILRTALHWEELPQPIQVVYRHATLPVEELALDPDRDALEQMRELMRPERQRLDLRRAPLMRLQVAANPHGTQWYAFLQLHHLVGDHESIEITLTEIIAHLEGQEQTLPEPMPYREHVAQALAYAAKNNAEAFFREKLGSIDEPTAPFGLMDVHGDGSRIEEVAQALEPELARRIREQARRIGVSAATLFHAAWGLVVAHTSARDDVVFGSLLLGRLHGSAGAQRILGMFINTLPLRLQLAGVSATRLVEQAHHELAELLSHEQASLAVAQRCSGISGAAPLFTTLLNYRHSNGEFEAAQSASAGMKVLASFERTNYPITMSIDDLGKGFTLVAQTDRQIDPSRVTGYLRTAVRSLVEALERAPQTPALALSILPDIERRQVLELFHAKAADYSQKRLIHQLFEEQAERAPHAVAVVYEEQSLTYGELNSRANQLARYLREKGVGPDHLVGICAERSLEMVIGLLAILKAGGAYVPLDPGYPPERLEHMLEDAAPSVLLIQERLRERLPHNTAQVVSLDGCWEQTVRRPAENLDPAELGVVPDHLAYVIYTSGSTGRPKGVMVEHRNVTRLFAATQAWFQFNEQHVWTLFHSFAFDFSVWELWGALLYGGRVVVVPHLTARSSREFYRLICEQKVTVLNQTPSAFAQLIDAQSRSDLQHSLRVVIFGGEALELRSLRSWIARNIAEQAQLVNMYGITETTVHVTYRPLTQQEIESERGSLIGQAIPDLRTYLLDERRQPVPIGVTGELYVGGAGVARGYLNRPELTAERFIPHPFSSDPNARLYKTGDLGRWRPDGSLEYLGRNDHQVKIRGFRIELAEIEAQIARHPQVKEVVVLAREDTPGEKRLVAYVIPQDFADAPGPLRAETLRTHSKTVLPEHMVPSAYVLLKSFPLTTNGKLDRKALPAPDSGAYARREYESPQGEIEEILAGIWQSLLRAERVGRQDNFFELGGHSLLIMQMLERLRRVGLSTEVRKVFDSPTLAALASALTREAVGEIEVPPNMIPEGCTAITPDMLPLLDLKAEHIERIVQTVPGGAANIQDIYPLAPLQEGILFHHLFDQKQGDIYVVSTLLSVSSSQRLDEFLLALQKVIDRHDALRTAVLWDQLPTPVQVVYRQAELRVENLMLNDGQDARAHIQERMKPERQRLDLTRAPLIRLQTAADAHASRWYVLVQLHHLICDHETMAAIVAEVVSHLTGHSPTPRDSIPYRNHVAQALAHARTHDAEAFFRQKLADIDEPTAPFGLLNVHGDGSQTREAHQELEPDMAKQVRLQARRLGVSAATLFHAAWALVLALTSARDDVVFGTVLLGRLQSDTGGEQALGMFINTLPLRLALRTLSARNLVQRTQQELVELLSYEQASLSVAQRCSALPGSVPLFTTLLNYRHSLAGPKSDWSNTAGIEVLADQERTNYPITLSIDDLGEGFVLSAQTDHRIDPHQITKYAHMAIQSIAAALEQEPGVPALSLFVLPENEKYRPVGPVQAVHRQKVPDATDLTKREHEEPQGDVERSMAKIWRESLNVDRVGRHDHFFQLGGHSLTALKVVLKTNHFFNSALGIIDIYHAPTIRDLATRISGSTQTDDLIDLWREATLDVDIQQKRKHVYAHKSKQSVLLTGSTGFVGRFLLAHLLSNTGATVYCLIRAGSQQQAADRLKRTLGKWDLWRPDFDRRVIAIPADLSRPMMSVDKRVYKALSDDVDTIYHCAASMNHLETYAMAKPANVEGGRELLRLATQIRPKQLNYISTLSVFNSLSAARSRTIDEDSPIEEEAHRSSDGYAGSKWVCEKLVMEAANRGISCNIFRLGLIWADTLLGRYDPLQREYRLLKSCLLSGYGIRNYRHAMPATPVDYAARAIIYLAAAHRDPGGIFHIFTPGQRSEMIFERCNRVAGLSLELMSPREWASQIERSSLGKEPLPIVPLLDSIRYMSDEHESPVVSEQIHFSCAKTQAELQSSGIAAPVLDDDLLRLTVQDMLTRDADMLRRAGDPYTTARELSSRGNLRETHNVYPT